MPSRKAKSIVSARTASAGRKRDVLIEQDARDLYKAAHRSQLIVFMIGSVQMRRDPRVDPATERVLLSLDQFFRYKAVLNAVQTDSNLVACVDRALASLGQLDCVDHRDPRVMPLHVFAGEHNLSQLGIAAGRANFDSTFGGATSRKDSSGRAWVTGPHHGFEELLVAGNPVPRGFHWDVQSGKNPSKLHNGWEVWELRGDGHLNISPDGNARQGVRSRRLWHCGMT